MTLLHNPVHPNGHENRWDPILISSLSSEIHLLETSRPVIGHQAIPRGSIINQTGKRLWRLVFWVVIVMSCWDTCFLRPPQAPQAIERILNSKVKLSEAIFNFLNLVQFCPKTLIEIAMCMDAVLACQGLCVAKEKLGVDGMQEGLALWNPSSC